MIDDHNAIISHTSETGTTHQVDAGEISRTAQADPQRGFSVSGPVFHPADGSASLRSQEGMVTASVSHDGFPAHELFLDGVSVYRFDPVSAGTTPFRLFPFAPSINSGPIPVPAGGASK